MEYKTVKIIPGVRPPMRSLPIDPYERPAYMTTIALGGMKISSTPPVAMIPVAIPLEYPFFNRRGIVADPIAAQVAIDEPERAPKIEQPTMVVIPKLPGSHLNQPVRILTRISPTPL